MKIKELRVGNWIYDHTDMCELQMSLDEFQMANNYTKSEHPLPFKPIPLTEEWLIRLGFESDSYANFYKKIATYAYLVVSFKDYACTQIRETVSIDDHDIEANCKYVHQLQNLYFALTNQELTIK